MKIYKTDNTIEDVPLGGKPATLDQLQAAVGGYIEAVPGSNHRAYCNEDGRQQQLPVNLLASRMFRRALVGAVVVLDKGDKQ